MTLEQETLLKLAQEKLKPASISFKDGHLHIRLGLKEYRVYGTFGHMEAFLDGARFGIAWTPEATK